MKGLESIESFKEEEIRFKNRYFGPFLTLFMGMAFFLGIAAEHARVIKAGYFSMGTALIAIIFFVWGLSFYAKNMKAMRGTNK